MFRGNFDFVKLLIVCLKLIFQKLNVILNRSNIIEENTIAFDDEEAALNQQIAFINLQLDHLNDPRFEEAGKCMFHIYNLPSAIIMRKSNIKTQLELLKNCRF